jgi:hypothetical protein
MKWMKHPHAQAVGSLPHGRLAFLLAALLTTACATGGGSAGNAASTGNAATYEIEIVVRSGENFRSAADVTALVDLAAQHHVAMIDVLAKQDEDGSQASGQAYYASTLLPRAPGFQDVDVLQLMVDRAHARGIQVRAWVPQFHDQVAALAHPAWQMMALQGGQITPYTGSRQKEYFVNPLDDEVQRYQLAVLQEITSRYAVDGVMLDWIRFDNYNMDLGPASRQRFMALGHGDPAKLDFAQPSVAVDAWNSFRTDGIARYVQRVRSALTARLHLGIFVLPPEFVEVGQDAAKFNTQVGSIAPMCYFRDWGFAVDWFWSSCMASTAKKASSSDLVPTMDTGLSEADYAQIMAHLRADYPQVKRLAWFAHGAWTPALMAQVERLSRP